MRSLTQAASTSEFRPAVRTFYTKVPAHEILFVDDVCADPAALGIPLLNGPIDRPWGRRTAAFADPAGNVWEVAQELDRG